MTTGDGSEDAPADRALAAQNSAWGSIQSTRRRWRAVLDRIRTRSRDRRIALVVVLAVGLALSWLHWLGLVAGGALVGVVSPTLRRAALGGLGFGAMVLVVFAFLSRAALGEIASMTPVVFLTVGAALALPVFGSLVRGLG